MMKSAILTSPDQWFETHAEKLSRELGADIFKFHGDIYENYDVLFILAYDKRVPQSIISKNKYNVVIHESDLPQGKGWAPFFSQILEGKKVIKFSLFEASDKVDAGDIYFQDELNLSGFELNSELREKQRKLTFKMCKKFISNIDSLPLPTPQRGKESFFRKRTPEDSRLDVNKTIAEQFNLLRIVNNDSYPRFFEIDGNKYFLKITKGGDG